MINYELELETFEVELLLEAVFRHYGYDFRNYAPASLKRRIWNAIQAEGLTTVSGLQEKVLHHRDCLERFLLMLCVNVTDMFREPSFYLAFRTVVVPLLRTYPFIRIWHAGLQERVQTLFYESLIKFGILGLGRQEFIRLTSCHQNYEELVSREKLYRKIC